MPSIENVRCVLLSSPYADADDPEIKECFPNGPKRTIGMVEVTLVKELVGKLRDYARGERIGFLTADSETERIEGPYYKKQLGLAFTAERYVKTMAEWKEAFVQMQGQVDALFFGNYAGISDWNEAEAAAFVVANSKVVSGGVYDYMMPPTLETMASLGNKTAEVYTWFAGPENVATSLALRSNC